MILCRVCLVLEFHHPWQGLHFASGGKDWSRESTGGWSTEKELGEESRGFTQSVHGLCWGLGVSGGLSVRCYKRVSQWPPFLRSEMMLVRTQHLVFAGIPENEGCTRIPAAFMVSFTTCTHRPLFLTQGCPLSSVSVFLALYQVRPPGGDAGTLCTAKPKWI